MSAETILGIWAGIATGLVGGLALALANLINERNAYRRKLDMGEPPRPTSGAKPWNVERKAGGA